MLSISRTMTAKSDNDFFAFMENRYHDTDKNAVGNLETRATFNRKNITKVRHAAQKMAAADRSDPFVGKRTLSSCIMGHAIPSDFQVNFRKEVRKLAFSPVGQEEYTVMVPSKISRP